MNNNGRGYAEQTNSENLSEFNDAIAQLQRIGNLWEQCHYFRRRANLQQWNVLLDSVWLELIQDCDDDDEKNISGVNKEYLKNKLKRDIIYQILIKKESILRKIQNDQGKGGKKKKDDDGL